MSANSKRHKAMHEITTQVETKLGTGKEGSEDGEFNWPWGITFDPINQQIIVSDTSNHRLQFFNRHDLSHLLTVGGPGCGKQLGQFNDPTGLAMQPHTNRLLVCDHDNHRLQVLSSSSSSLDHPCQPLYAIGSKEGNADGKFRDPFGVCCSPKGEMIVADTFNHRVQLFDPAGRFLTTFGTRGDRDTQLNRPFDVCYLSHHFAPSSSASSLLLLADHHNNRVSIWSGDSGRPQHIFNLKCNNYTRGVCVDLNGFVYVSVLPSFVCIYDPRKHYTMLQQLDGFNRPTGLCVDDHNTLMVADSSSHQVLFFD